MNLRAVAATVVDEVVYKQRSLNQSLSPALSRVAPADVALLQEISYGCVRKFSQLEKIANHLLHTPLKTKHQDVLCLLVVGIYQILYLNVPTYAAVSETVSAASILKKNWAKGLINKILRHFSTHKDQILKTIPSDLVYEYSHPLWMIENIQAAWPQQWEAILKANNEAPPFYLRVNTQHLPVEKQIERLLPSLLPEKVDGFPEAIRIHSTFIENLPGFKEGDIYVQDISGQLAVHLLEVSDGMSVLDGCAAPGSKTTHLLTLYPHCQVTAVDNHPERLKKLMENMHRLHLPHKNLHLVLSDASQTHGWWSGELFDRILLDAPCSGSGVIRRHPDIKWTKTQKQLDQLVNQQQRLLERLWPLLKPHGKLLYATCSIFPEENTELIKHFLGNHTDAALGPLENLPLGFPTSFGWQILPSPEGGDGFFYAQLQKKA